MLNEIKFETQLTKTSILIENVHILHVMELFTVGFIKSKLNCKHEKSVCAFSKDAFL